MLVVKMRWFRWVQWLVGMVLCSSMLPALASHTQKQPVSLQVSVYKDSTSEAGMTAAQIAAKPDTSFAPFDPNAIYDTGLQKHLWLRLRVSSTLDLDNDDWLVGVSKPFVDTVVLHTRDKNGAWSSQASGDRLAHQLWPVRSLAPQFFVPAQLAGSQDLYFEVRNRTPLRFEVTSLSAADAALKAQNNFFLIGLAIGLMLLMIVASAVLTIVYRNTVYVWYGAYVSANTLVCLAYSGLGSYAIWPHAKDWPEASITLLYMLGNVLQLQFCRIMFFSVNTSLWARRTALYLVALGFVSIGLNIYAIANFGTSLVFTLHVLIFTSVSFIIIVSQFGRKDPASWLYLLSCIPLTIVGWLAVIEHSGWIALYWLPYNAPIYAFALEMPILFAAIYLHAKAHHAQAVRISTLASTNPSTGFVSSSKHMDTLVQLWNEAQAAKRDLVVVYVQVTHQLDPMSTIGGPGRTRSIERAVRLIRTVAREQDTVAHVGTDLFAVLMPDLSIGESLTNRLARLVALAVMTDQDVASHVPMRFRLVASSTVSFQGSAAKLHAGLKRKLDQSDWGQRAIRYVRSSWAARKRAVSSQPEETLSQFWERAATDENYPATRQDKPAS